MEIWGYDVEVWMDHYEETEQNKIMTSLLWVLPYDTITLFFFLFVFAIHQLSNFLCRKMVWLSLVYIFFSPQILHWWKLCCVGGWMS